METKDIFKFSLLATLAAKGEADIPTKAVYAGVVASMYDDSYMKGLQVSAVAAFYGMPFITCGAHARYLVGKHVLAGVKKENFDFNDQTRATCIAMLSTYPSLQPYIGDYIKSLPQEEQQRIGSALDAEARFKDKRIFTMLEERVS